MRPAARGSQPFLLPPLVARLAGRLPQWPPSLALAAALSLALGRLIDAEPLAPLRGKRIALHVTDAALTLRVIFTGRRFEPVLDARRPPDVMISASAHDFLLLALRKADPDSLFFSRRLLMEGDTELGLLVKNTLDAVDFTALLPRS